jgi:hypothetical protein
MLSSAHHDATSPERVRLAAGGSRDVTRPGAWLRGWLQADGALHVATLAAILGWGFWLRLVHLRIPMRHDEASTFIQYVSRPLLETLYRYDLQNNHVLSTLLMHGAWRLLGDSPAVLRLPALVAGILGVPAAYLVARRLYGREVALLAASLTAAASELIKYSTNARGYSLMTLFFLLLVAVADALRRAPTPTRWALFVACVALGIWSVASMLYAFAGVLLWLTLSVIRDDVAAPRRRFAFQLAAATAGAAVLVLVLYSPVLIWGDVGHMAHVYGRRVRAWSDFWARHARGVARLWTDWHLGVPALLVPLVPGLALVGLLGHRRLATTRVPAILAIALAPVPVVLVQRVSIYPRIWSYLLPLYLTLVAGGIVSLVGRLGTPAPRGRARVVAAMALILTLGLGLNVVRQRTVPLSYETGFVRDVPAITAFLRPRLGPGDRVSITPEAFPSFVYYFKRAGVPDAFLEAPRPETRRVFTVVVLRGQTPAGTAPPVSPAKPGSTWSDGALVAVFDRFEPVAIYERWRRGP